MITVKNRLITHDKNDDKESLQEIIVESHWNDPCMVVLKIGNIDAITVLAADLENAIKNVKNSGRF